MMKSTHQILRVPALLIAFTLVAPLLHAQGSAVDEASEAQLKTAKAAYDRGLEAMEDAKYSEALEQFKQSFAMVSSPNSQLMVGRALVKLGRLPEAYAEFRRALQQARYLSASQQKYQKTSDSAQSELDSIKEKLAYVIVPQGASAKIQGRTVGASNEDEQVAVLPGAVSIDMTYADGTSQTKQVSLGPGDKAYLPARTPSGNDRNTSSVDGNKQAGATEASQVGDLGMSRKTLGYIVGGVGVFGVATFVGVGLLGASVFGDPKGDCSQKQCPEAAVDNQASRSLYQGIGYAGLGMGLAGLGIGAWLVLGGNDKAKTTTALHLGPGLIQVNHRF